MASFHHVLQQLEKRRVESPAKVFAKLKSKVQREELYAKDGELSNAASQLLRADRHGGDFILPTKNRDFTWTAEDLKENQRFDPSLNEAQVLTLSPIPSPQKTWAASYLDTSSKPAQREPPWAGGSPRKRAFLESTAVSHPLSEYKRTPHTKQPHSRNTESIMLTNNRTPVKMKPELEDYGKGVFLEDSAPASVFSPMSNRLRKRKLRPLDLNGVNNEVFNEPEQRRTSRAYSEDDIHTNTHMEDLGHGMRSSENQPESQSSHEDRLPTMSAALKRCQLPAERNSLMSPAKMFAYMKERESKAEPQGVDEVSSSTRDLFDNHCHQSRGTPPSAANYDEEDPVFMTSPDSIVPAEKPQEESADSQSDTEPAEDISNPAEPSQLVSLEDPLVLDPPTISIPKKRAAVFKKNQWPQTATFPCESVIHLKKWYLRRNHKGIFVDGIRQDDNIPWASNIVVDRINNSVLKTISGRVYILVGKMKMIADSGFPKWFLKKFVDGFPANWKALYERFLSEKDIETSKSGGRGRMSKAQSETSSVMKQKKKPPKTPASCPPAPLSSAQVSRSGRRIKPPLEYWRGGRVILDAHMNVTIHECYETSICIPEVNTRVSTRTSQKPARVFLSCAEDFSGRESTSSPTAAAPQRRVKSQPRRYNKSEANPERKTSSSPQSAVVIQSSSEDSSSTSTRSRRRRPASEKRMHVDAIPQKQTEPEKSAKKPKQQMPESIKPTGRVLRRRQAISSSPESTVDHDQPENDDVLLRRTIKTNRKRGENVQHKSKQSNKLQPSLSSESFEEGVKETKKTKVTKNPRVKPKQSNNLQSSPSSESFEEGVKETKKTKVTKNPRVKPKQSNSTKTSPPSQPQPKSTKTKEKKNVGITPPPDDDDEAEWTEAELLRLKEAVSFYPKNMSGYWAKVARMVGTRSAEDCHRQAMSKATSETPAKKPTKSRKQKVEAPKDTGHAVITARMGTLKRKQEVRQFLKSMPKEDVDDVFTSASMHKRQFEMPSMCPSEDLDCAPSEYMLRTPGSTGFPEVKTPQCLDVRPDMIDSPNTDKDDKYTFQLQKRMRKYQYNVYKQAPSAKSFTPSAKRAMRRCGNTENDTFVVWEMFPGDKAALSDSEEDDDFYFSDND